MDNPEDWIDAEGEGAEIFKDVEVGYDSNDPMLKALAGSDVSTTLNSSDQISRILLFTALLCSMSTVSASAL